MRGWAKPCQPWRRHGQLHTHHSGGANTSAFHQKPDLTKLGAVLRGWGPVRALPLSPPRRRRFIDHVAVTAPPVPSPSPQVGRFGVAAVFLGEEWWLVLPCTLTHKHTGPFSSREEALPEHATHSQASSFARTNALASPSHATSNHTHTKKEEDMGTPLHFCGRSFELVRRASQHLPPHSPSNQLHAHPRTSTHHSTSLMHENRLYHVHAQSSQTLPFTSLPTPSLFYSGSPGLLFHCSPPHYLHYVSRARVYLCANPVPRQLSTSLSICLCHGTAVRGGELAPCGPPR